ncbi:hypothetical protein PUMCH_000524 [Australozyma saopauloensis]|uniref:CID domain-containing protein n=1 Tax=Australozyma saopauloensis TaxID=291208 RepID=A0AAX4H4Z9_9ASCO|nr:hypothetical protein PUMCH_000524 [[Candida] saopauloensis]
MTNPDEPFSAEYYQHMLLSLTLNSKALITELTALAEIYVDNAPEIVRLIEDRITKILPKYKLFSFYLLDSVIKNIGNPYNLLFAKNLYKTFTESYLIVEDTHTRQDLINLFQTWMTGQSSNGLEIFPKEVLQKIETFIIKATSLAGGSAQGAPKVNRDAILREGNVLLQHIIAMDDELERFEDLTPDYTEQIQQWRRFRNDLVFEINTICESTMTKAKDAFERLKDGYAEDLRRIRKDLDGQAVQQQNLIKEAAQAPTTTDAAAWYPELNNVYKRVRVLMILDPKDEKFMNSVKCWGQPKENVINLASKQDESSQAAATQLPKSQIAEPIAFTEELAATAPLPSLTKPNEISLAQSLGLDFASIDFPDFGKDKIRHGSFDECEDAEDGDGDGYDPEHAIALDHEPQFIPKEPRKDIVVQKLSLKRARDSEERVVKRVRFDD